MPMRVHRSPHAHAPAAPANAALKAQLAKDYLKGFEKVPGYTLFDDPEKAAALKGTKALATYKATLGEGKNLNLVTDGDHLVYRAKSGQVCVLTYPDDAGRGDGLWVYDQTGQKLLAQGVAHEGHVRWKG